MTDISHMKEELKIIYVKLIFAQPKEYPFLFVCFLAIRGCPNVEQVAFEKDELSRLSGWYFCTEWDGRYGL